jgi:hypothetical protein
LLLQSTESTQQAGPTGSTEQGQQQQQEQQRQQEQQQQGASSSSNPGEDVKQRLRQGFNAFRSTVGDGNLLGSIASEVKDVFKSGPGIQSATRKYTGPVADLKAYDGPAALMLVEQQQTAWQRFRQQVGHLLALWDVVQINNFTWQQRHLGFNNTCLMGAVAMSATADGVHSNILPSILCQA